MFQTELKEKVKCIEDLWIYDLVSPEEREKLIQNCKLQKEYYFGKYKDIKLMVWAKNESKIYEVVNVATGATKCITNNWNKAYAIAKQLSTRYRMLYMLY